MGTLERLQWTKVAEVQSGIIMREQVSYANRNIPGCHSNQRQHMQMCTHFRPISFIKTVCKKKATWEKLLRFPRTVLFECLAKIVFTFIQRFPRRFYGNVELSSSLDGVNEISLLKNVHFWCNFFYVLARSPWTRKTKTFCFNEALLITL